MIWDLGLFLIPIEGHTKTIMQIIFYHLKLAGLLTKKCRYVTIVGQKVCKISIFMRKIKIL